MSEQALVDMAKEGDLTAFNRLVVSHQTVVYNLALRIMGDPAAAEDAAQEAFISAYRKLGGFRGGSFRAWLMRIVTNACYDELRRYRRRPQTPLEDLNPLDEPAEVDSAGFLQSDEEGPEAAADRAELARALRECLDRLPLEFKVVAVLVDVQGFDYKEAAEVMDKPLGTVKSRLARARSRMQECLQGYRELLPLEMRLESERT
ncbi:MAG TPA: sigma-70 family RNA polymerase sigma factor [Anaerolineales bacterium]|jgi:RNA polymerase sigma-70 factor (ECF subfamily)